MGGEPTPRRSWTELRALPGRLLDRATVALLEACIRRARRIGDRRLAAGRPRTLWGITPILTLPLKARCDEELGFKAETLVFTTYHTTRNFTWNLRNLMRLSRLWPRSERPLARIILALALLRYDFFNTFADRGIMPSAARFGIAAEELDALNRAGKRLYVYGYGADVRTRAATLALGTWNFCRDCAEPGRHCICDDSSGLQQMAAVARHATAVVLQADMLAYMPTARHLAYWPIDTGAVRASVPMTYTGACGALRIAHAPNHTHFKGTRYLEASIARLAAKGVAIELVQISGAPNARVLELFADCDLVADQFIGGAYGYAALEAMASAKPVLTYVRDRNLLVAADECPLIDVTPDTIDTVLEWCVQNHARLPAIGWQGRAYVERHHAIAAVAARFARLYLDTARLPTPVEARLTAFIAAEAARCGAVQQASGWQHPFTVAALLQPVPRAAEKCRA
jgi:glycosyltransferase involved in cell wall biosynthesis